MNPIDASAGGRRPARSHAAIAREAEPPGGQPRADRLRERRQPRGARGAGLGPHQQVRRGLSRASATTAAASSSTSSSSSPSTAPRRCSAPSTPTCSRTRARRRTWRSTSRSSQPGDTILAMDLSHGGHLTHGSPVNFSGKFFKVVPYGVRARGRAHRLRRGARAGARAPAEDDRRRAQRLSARRSTSQPFRDAADEVGAKLIVDMAHFAGLVAAGDPSVAGAARGVRHHHHAQDAARSARRHDPGARERGEGDQLARSSPATRAAR